MVYFDLTDSLFYIFIFLLGLVVGSFLYCLIYRLETGKGFLRGRSFCPRCGRRLGLWDLIPILSFLALRGRCRYCGQQISLQYPLVELATGVLFLLIFLVGVNNYAMALLFTFFGVVIFVYDLKHYLIPDKVIYPAISAALIFNLGTSDVFVSALASAFGAAAFFGTIVLISRGKWMGVGDIKLAFLMGLVLSFPNILVALFLAFLIGAIIGIGLILWGDKTLKSEVPFGPFLVTGTLIAMFWGERLAGWYI